MLSKNSFGCAPGASRSFSNHAALQARSVAWFEKLRDAPGAQPKEFFDSTLDYALRHQDVIARFGRFPHRNAILGRPSTAEEMAYLAQPGAGF